ncbi:MAG TPA: FAD-dependent oxidoreductase [Thermoanaerobaculia bacterium]|jgi:hypothetical protein
MARVIVVGAGPMGIAAALGAIDRGHDVTVLERGEVGASLRTWGATRFFSPLAMNVSPRMRELLATLDGTLDDALDDGALLTGSEYADRILVPLSEREPLRGRVRTGHRVVAIGRRGLTRGGFAGHPLRAERPFRVLVESAAGEELLEAEHILDASGGLVVPRPFGVGGLPVRGESRLARRPIRTLGELLSLRDQLRGKRVLLVGDGHSAANAIVFLDALAREDANTRVVWAVRTPNRRPCEEVANDPLPERDAIVARANALAETPPPYLTMQRRAMIDAVVQTNGHVTVALTGDRSVEADYIAAFTGYRPDASFISELTVETSPVTEGGARLYNAIANVTDCLSVPKVRPHDLESGEPGYWFIGSRGYGRARTFLLQTGLQQLETVLACIPKAS